MAVLKYNPEIKEAAKSQLIGAIALALMLAVGGAVVAADAPLLFAAVRHLCDVIAPHHETSRTKETSAYT